MIPPPPLNEPTQRSQGKMAAKEIINVSSLILDTTVYTHVLHASVTKDYNMVSKVECTNPLCLLCVQDRPSHTESSSQAWFISANNTSFIWAVEWISFNACTEYTSSYYTTCIHTYVYLYQIYATYLQPRTLWLSLPAIHIQGSYLQPSILEKGLYTCTCT